MKVKKKIAFVVSINFLVFLIAFSVLTVVSYSVHRLDTIKFNSVKLLRNIHYLNYITQSIITNRSKKTVDVKKDFIKAVQDFENTLNNLVEQSDDKIKEEKLTKKLNAAVRLWQFSKQDLMKINNILVKLIDTNIDSRKGPMNSLLYYHNNLKTHDLYNTEDHYYLVQLENTIDMVLGGAYSYNATLQSLVKDINKKADEYIKLSFILSIFLVIGFVFSALLMVYMFSHQSLARQVDKLLNEAVENVEEKRLAELRALHFQINPHFLYNTLSSISLMAIKNNDRVTAQMIKKLSRLLRNTISREPDFISIRQELKVLNDYVDLLQIRYYDRIEYEIDISEKTIDLLIPSFVLQPLVENAVSHGLSEKLNQSDARAKLKIEGYCKFSKLYINVIDNGVGIDKNDFHFLFEEREFKKGHIGIRNIHDRIRNHFSDGYGVEIKSELNKYTCIRLNLPIIEKGEEHLY